MGHRQFSPAVSVALAAVALVVALLALVGWVRVAQSAAREQPLSITACTPDSYDAPTGIEPGPEQERCDRWFTPRGDQWPITEPIRVVGQVCNQSPDPVSYQIEVAFESLTGARFGVIDVPITYDPGCQPAYDFEFLFPGPASQAGEWRIVGRADPLNTDRYLPYSWDATSTVELVDEGVAP